MFFTRVGRPRDLIRSGELPACRADEAEEVATLAEADRWPHILATFCAKEAIYKAIHRALGRPVRFDEVSLRAAAVPAAPSCRAARSGGPPAGFIVLRSPFAGSLDLHVARSPRHVMVAARTRGGD